MSTPATNLLSSERSLYNRYLPLGFRLGIMRSELGRDPPHNTRPMFAIGFFSPFPQEVSGTVNRGIWNNVFVSEKSPRCTICFQQPVQPLSLICVRSRCDKVAFTPLLAFAATTLLTQMVLTLRFVAPDIGKLRADPGWIERNKRRHG